MTEGAFQSEELVAIGMVGVLREVSALFRNRPSAHKADESQGWTLHIKGAAAEAAVAKETDHYWRPLARRPRDLPGDVGTGIQVRSTDHADGHLIVYPTDPDDARFYLVITDLPRYRIAGSIMGRDAKQRRFWRDSARDGAFWVPQSELHS